MHSELFIFWGYPKCATSTLQKHFFSQHSELKYLGLYPTKNIGSDSSEIDIKSPYISDVDVFQLHENLSKNYPVGYSYVENKLLFEKLLAKYKASPKIMFGSEFFMSTLFCYPNVSEKMKRIQSIFKDKNVKNILIIRNQIEWLKSQYRDHPFDPNNIERGNPVSFNKWVTILLDNNATNPLLENIKFYERIIQLETLFGKGNVKVVMMEDLQHNLDKFSYDISSFLNINEFETKSLLSNKHENIRSSALFTYLRNFHRQYFPSFNVGHFFSDNAKNNINRMLNSIRYFDKKTPLELTPNTLAKLDVFFEESNQLLNKKLDGALSKRNYIGVTND
jgi:hypothetical protein